MNIAIITGASSGIGKEFALQLDAGLYTIDEFWLIARRKDRLEELACDLDHMAKTIPLDLTQEADMEHLRALLRKERPAVRMLINCSGYGIMGQFSEIDSREQVGMIDLNCRALTEITHACLPYMKKKQPHHPAGKQRRLPAPARLRRICSQQILRPQLFPRPERRTSIQKNLRHCRLPRPGSDRVLRPR